MPWSVAMEDKGTHSLARVNGEGTLEDIISLIHTVLEDESYKRTGAVLIDTGDQVGLIGKANTLRGIERWVRENDHLFTGSRWAVLTSSLLYFGFVRMYQAWRHDASYEVTVFRSRSDAEAWLQRQS